MGTRILAVEVSDSNYEKVRDLLMHLTYVERVNDIKQRVRDAVDAHFEHAIEEAFEEAVEEAFFQKVQAKIRENMFEKGIDEVTLLSQASLAEEWDSEEDARYDELYRAKHLKNEAQAR